VRKSIIDTPTESIDTYLTDEFENNFKRILTEELIFKSVEKQKEVKNQISTFITTFASENASGYVELPYYLVIAAKRAGLGDLEKLQFSRKKDENGEPQLIAVGQQVDLRNIRFEVEKQYIEKTRETFAPDELKYITAVESAHQQLQSLRNVQGAKWLFWESHRGDLDIPTEIANDIDQHRKEWNTLKERLLYYDPSISSQELLEEYINYYEYFSALYRGMLLSLNGFKVSNDIDTIELFQRAMGNGYKDFFDEKGNLKKENVTKEKDEKKGKETYELPIKGEGIEEFYNMQIAQRTYAYTTTIVKQEQGADGVEREVTEPLVVEKTIKELWESTEEKEKEMAKRYSTQIVTAMMETILLKTDKDVNITSINTGKLRMYKEDETITVKE
jgi:hypothetical protein